MTCPLHEAVKTPMRGNAEYAWRVNILYAMTHKAAKV